jgi:BlaI family penicillinase repressor
MMMMRRGRRPEAAATPQPTEVELEILRVLWRLGPSTVRQVHEALTAEKGTGYSTALKMMQVMRDKGLLVRDDSVRPQVYRPVQSQEHTQLQMLDNLVQKAFGGSAARLLMRALSAKRVSPDELAEMEVLIRRSRGGPPGGDAKKS